MKKTLQMFVTLVVLTAMLFSAAAPAMAEEEQITLTVAWGAIESSI